MEQLGENNQSDRNPGLRARFLEWWQDKGRMYLGAIFEGFGFESLHRPQQPPAYPEAINFTELVDKDPPPRPERNDGV